MNKKGELPKIKPALTLLLMGVALLIGIYVAGGFKIVGELREQSSIISENTEKVNTAVENLNSNLNAIQEIPSQVESIQSDISLLKQKSDALNSDMTSFAGTENEFEQSILSLDQKIESLNLHVEELNTNVLALKSLQDIYPPVQTQELIFNNVSNQELNQAIQNAINIRSRSFGVYFSFGSLFGSLFSVSIYFIWRFYNKRKWED